MARRARDARAGPAVDGVADELLGPLLAFDTTAGQQAFDRLLGVRSLDAALREVVLPVLREVGERWARGEITVAQEHFATELITGRLRGLAREWDHGLGPRAVLACPSGERHDVGLLCCGLALRPPRLARDLPRPGHAHRGAGERGRRARSRRSSSSAPSSPAAAGAAAAALAGLADRCPIAVGGAGANAELAAAARRAALCPSDPVEAAASADRRARSRQKFAEPSTPPTRPGPAGTATAAVDRHRARPRAPRTRAASPGRRADRAEARRPGRGVQRGGDPERPVEGRGEVDLRARRPRRAGVAQQPGDAAAAGDLQAHGVGRAGAGRAALGGGLVHRERHRRLRAHGAQRVDAVDRLLAQLDARRRQRAQVGERLVDGPRRRWRRPGSPPSPAAARTAATRPASSPMPTLTFTQRKPASRGGRRGRGGARRGRRRRSSR